MNIKEVIEKCNNSDYVIDKHKRRWKVDNGKLISESEGAILKIRPVSSWRDYKKDIKIKRDNYERTLNQSN